MSYNDNKSRGGNAKRTYGASQGSGSYKSGSYGAGKRTNSQDKTGYGEKRSAGSYGAGKSGGYQKAKSFSGGQSKGGYKSSYNKSGENGFGYKGRDSYDPYVQRGAAPLPKSRPQAEKKPVKSFEKPAKPVERTPVEIPQPEDETLLVGRNAVWEALKAGRAMERLYVAQGVDETSLQGILGVAYREKVKVERTSRNRLTEIAGTDKHQGVLAYLSAMEYTPLDKLIDDAFEATDKPVFILLDEVQDPHNLGAIIRTADCAGANGIIILEHRAVGLTATVSKVSAGALAHMPVAKATNLVRAMQQLQERGVRMIGADMGGVTCYDCDFTDGPLGLVIGNEGVGLRRLVREQCDVLAGIPIYGHVDSLNASVAAAVMMFEAVRQRKFAK